MVGQYWLFNNNNKRTNVEKSSAVLLEGLYEVLEEARSPLCGILQKGLSRKTIDDCIQDLKVNFLPEMYELYSWRNGVREEDLDGKTLGEFWLFPMGFFPPIDFAIEDYRVGMDIGWSSNYFPLFASGGGDYYLIDCDKQSMTYKMVLYDSPSNIDFEGIVSKFDSLNSLLEAITECYKRKVYYYDFNKDRNLFVNRALEKEIFMRHNPKSDYWKIFK